VKDRLYSALTVQDAVYLEQIGNLLMARLDLPRVIFRQW
jgi:hypothetical protein